MKEIIIDISEEGEVFIETRGFQGKACLEETQFLKDLLGKQTFQQLTPAYFINEQQQKKKYLNLCG
jgi:hypothetical protein